MTLANDIQRAFWNGASIDMEEPQQIQRPYWNGASIDMEIGIARVAYWDGASIDMVQVWPLGKHLAAPGLAIADIAGGFRLTITDNSVVEAEWEIHRSVTALFTAGPSTLIDTVASVDPIGTTGTQDYDDDTVPAADTYYYQVRGKTGDATSPVSNEVSGVFLDFALDYEVSYPKDKAAADDTIEHRFMAMPAGANRIHLWKREGADFADDQDPEADGTSVGTFEEADIVSAVYDDNGGYAHNLTIYYQARASWNSVVYGSWMVASVPATNITRAPTIPTSVSQSNVAGDLEVVWTPGAGGGPVTTFRINYESRDCNIDFTTYPGTDTTDPTSPATIPIIEGKGEHARAQVRSEGPGGNSAYVEATPTGGVEFPGNPGVPTGRSLTHNPTNPINDLDAAWTLPATGAWDSFSIRYRAFGSADAWTTITDISDVATSLTIFGVADDFHFEGEIIAVGLCPGDDSGWVSLGGAWTAPALPTSLTWSTDPAPVAGKHDQIDYAVMATDGDDIEVYGQVGASAPDEFDTLHGDSLASSLTQNTQYTFAFRARNQPTVGSTHSASAWVWSTDVGGPGAKTSSTYRDRPNITSWADDGAICPVDWDLVVSHANSYGETRASAWRWRAAEGGAPGGGYSSKTAGQTTVVGALTNVDDGVEAYVEAEYTHLTIGPTASANATTTCVDPCVTPATPSGGIDNAETLTSLRLDWTVASGDFTGIDIEIRPFATAFSDVATHTDTGTSPGTKVLGSLTNNSKYHAQIRTTGCDGNGPWTSVGNGYTTVAAAGALSWSTAPGATDDTSDEIEYALNTTADAIERYYDTNATVTEVDSGAGTSSTTGLAVSTEHWFAGRHRNEAIAGSPHADSAWVWSSTLSATTHPDRPSVTTNGATATEPCSSWTVDATLAHGSRTMSAGTIRYKVNAGSWNSKAFSAGETNLDWTGRSGINADDTITVEAWYTSEGSGKADSDTGNSLCFE